MSGNKPSAQAPTIQFNPAARLAAPAWLRHLLLLALAAILSACQSAPPPAPKFIAAGIHGLNHTPVFIGNFSVDDDWGSNISAWGGGGSTTCCFSLPYQYSAGMTAKVRWKPSGQAWREAIVPIEPYADGGGSVWVHFFLDDKVRIVVSNYDPGHPKHPAPSPRATLRAQQGVAQ